MSDAIIVSSSLPGATGATGPTGATGSAGPKGNSIKYSYFGSAAGNYTSTSASYVAIDATNLSQSLTVAGGIVKVTLSSSVRNSGGTDTYLGLFVDGTLVAGGEYQGQLNNEQLWNSTWLLQPSAGAHTFELRWRRDTSGTLTMSRNSTQSLVFMVEEIS